MSTQTRFMIILLLTAFASSCGQADQSLATDPTVTKSDIISLDGKADGYERICEFLGLDADCDICEALDFYSDGECDDFCLSIDDDCLPSETNTCDDCPFDDPVGCLMLDCRLDDPEPADTCYDLPGFDICSHDPENVGDDMVVDREWVSTDVMLGITSYYRSGTHLGQSVTCSANISRLGDHPGADHYACRYSISEHDYYHEDTVPNPVGLYYALELLNSPDGVSYYDIDDGGSHGRRSWDIDEDGDIDLGEWFTDVTNGVYACGTKLYFYGDTDQIILDNTNEYMNEIVRMREEFGGRVFLWESTAECRADLIKYTPIQGDRPLGENPWNF